LKALAGTDFLTDVYAMAMTLPWASLKSTRRASFHHLLRACSADPANPCNLILGCFCPDAQASRALFNFMSVATISHVLLLLWVASLACLAIRLFHLKLHLEYLLFTVSTALSVVFGFASAQFPPNAPAQESLGLLGNTMDIFLEPSIALELFGVRSKPATQSRFWSPLILMMMGGLGISAFLLASPDNTSFEAASSFAFIIDTGVTVFVLIYVIRQIRESGVAPDRNLRWLRRLFVFELAMSVARGALAFVVSLSYSNILDILFFGTGLIATAICTFGLRKAPVPSPNL
jgi:hypothetical protein